MPVKYALIGLIVLCITILSITLMTRHRLCQLTFKEGNIELQAVMNYESIH